MSGDKDIENQIPEDEFTEDTDFSAETGDDFGEDSFAEGDDFGDEGWDEGYEEEEYGEEMVQDEEAAARSKKFNNIVIGVTVIIALGVGGFKMMSAQGPAQPAGQQEQQYQKAEFTKGNDDAPPAPYGVSYGQALSKEDMALDEQDKEPPKGLINNPGALKQLRNTGTLSYEEKPKPEAPEPTGYQYQNPRHYPSPEEVTGTPPQPAPISQLGDSQGDVNDAPRGEEYGLIPMPEETQNAELNDLRSLGAFDDEPAPQDAPQSAMQSDQLADIMSEEQTEQAQNMTDGYVPRNSGTASGDVASKLDMLLDQMNALGSKVDGLGKDISAIEESQNALEAKVRKLENAPRTSSSARSSSSANSSRSRSTSPARSSARASNWVLKSAQPGQAMIAKKGSNDMLQISVGESLSGLGRITSISIVGGKWVVQGTSGKITQ